MFKLELVLPKLSAVRTDVATSIVAVALTLPSAGPALAAGAGGTWSLTGNMTTARTGGAPILGLHVPALASVLLPDGKVLVVGGSGDQSSAELYDPATRTWSQTGRAVTPANTLMMLPDGKVLAGEVDPFFGGLTGPTELYDPITRKWSPSSIPLGLLLPDGTILVNGSPPVTYDLHSGKSSPTEPHVASRFAGTLTLLGNGKVLAAGGSDPVNGGPSPRPELYEPSTRTWSLTGDIAEERSFATAVVLADDKVLIAGGEISDFATFGGSISSLSSAVLYDPVTGTWGSGGDAGFSPNSLTLLADGQVLAAGGQSWQTSKGFGIVGCNFFSSALLFDETKRTWTPTGSMIDPFGRPAHATALLNDRSVLVAGGSHPVAVQPPETFGGSCDNRTSPALASAEVYTPPTSTVLPSTCKLTLTGTNANKHPFIRVAARDIASGLESVKVLQATNATVALPEFAPGNRDPAVVTATKIDAIAPSTLALSVTNTAGKTITCDPVLANLEQGHGAAHQVFRNLPQAESILEFTNGTPGLKRVRVQVNRQQFRLDDLRDGEVRTLDVAHAMQPGDTNTISVRTHGPRGSNALLVISD